MKNRIRYIIYIVTIYFFNVGLYSQNINTVDKLKIKEANKYFQKSDIENSKKGFEVLSKNNKTSKYGNYGLGICSLKEKNAQKALEYFEKVVGNEKELTKEEKHSVYHNMGNIMYRNGDYAKAIEYYENSLINNPEDDETRYNLVMAQKMQNKQNNQNNQNNNSGNNQNDKQDKNKDNPQSNNNGDLNNNNNQREKEDITEKEANQLLETFKQDEQKTRERILKTKANNGSKNKKNW